MGLGQQALFEARQHHRERKDLLLLLANYRALGSDPAPSIPGLRHKIEHPCQWETSMMMHLRPDLVSGYRTTVKVDWGNPFAPAPRAWTMPEIGEALVRTYSADVVRFSQEWWNGTEGVGTDE